MNMCDPGAVEIILTFAIGGITLRALIAIVKDWTKATGLLAVVIGLVMCALASTAYMLITSSFTWTCLIFYTAEVFAGTQLAYRATHR